MYSGSGVIWIRNAKVVKLWNVVEIERKEETSVFETIKCHSHKERKDKGGSRLAAHNIICCGCNVQIRYDSMSNLRSLLHQGFNEFLFHNIFTKYNLHQ